MAGKLQTNPWLKIWLKPRETIQQIVNFDPKYAFYFLSGIYGFNMLMNMAQNLSLGKEYSLSGILLGLVILSVFVGMLFISITSGLLLWTGKWIGGKGTYYPIRASVAWSNVPIIVNIILWLILVAYFKREVFIDSFTETPFFGKEMVLTTFVFLIQSVLSIWSFVIMVKGLAQVQGFSAWKGLLNILIPFFMVGIATWLISHFVWMMRGMPN